MLGKLIKYNNRPIARIILPFYLVLLCITIVTCIISVNKSSSLVIEIFKTLSTFMYIISLLAMLFGTMIAILLHFYQNSVSDQAYFTYSIPATIHQHIISKTIVGTIWMFLSMIACVISVAFLGFCNRNSDLIEDIREKFKLALEQIKEFTSLSSIALLVLLLLFLILTIVVQMLVAQFCFAGGQLFRDHKILGSIAMYIIYYTAGQVLTMIPLAILLINYGLHMSIEQALTTISISSIFIYIITIVTSYYFTHRFLSKKLNLE